MINKSDFRGERTVYALRPRGALWGWGPVCEQTNLPEMAFLPGARWLDCVTRRCGHKSFPNAQRLLPLRSPQAAIPLT